MVLVTSSARSSLMRAVRSKDTKPELIVRSIVHRLGARFRLHRKDLPGSPDLVFPARRLCIFVHGCFWHRHEGCRYSSAPKSNKEFWMDKFQKNVERDNRKIQQLIAAGWRVEVVWECETRNRALLESRLICILDV